MLISLLQNEFSRTMPELLVRGWRPDGNFYETESSTRAKNRWQNAISKVLMGEIPISHASNDFLSEEFSLSKRKIYAIWKWRFLLFRLLPNRENTISFIQPRRRVISSLALKWLFDRKPGFRWAHPRCVLLSFIPISVTISELNSIVLALIADDNELGAVPFKIHPLQNSKVDYWNAYIHFTRKTHFLAFVNETRRVNGVKVADAENFPWIQAQLTEARARFQEADAEFKVYQNATNQARRREAEKDVLTAQLGLRIFSREHRRTGHIVCSLGHASLREAQPRSSSALIKKLDSVIYKANGVVAYNEAVKVREEPNANRLKRLIAQPEISSQLRATSAFESLQALRNGDHNATHCAVCLGSLGDGDQDRLVTLTRCGHLFCHECFTGYCRQKSSEGLVLPPCITCRKAVAIGELKVVDPSRTADQEAFEEKCRRAKALVRQAADMLDCSKGRLEPELWEALYLAIDPPPDAHRSAHHIHTAIPSNALAHLRLATSMPVDSHPNTTVSCCSLLTSKVRALLTDIPRDELSVVFTSSKQSVRLLSSIFNHFNIGYRALFTGQSEERLELAVQEWQNKESVNVLIVQAGAAACGLTLTAASKMFILEPFTKYEEEQQAYARLHRYGQKNEVLCKVYYSPVSVESRLLEWRKRATGGVPMTEEEKILYAPLRSENIDESNSSSFTDEDQTRFLLGLEKQPMTTTTTTDMPGYSSEVSDNDF